MHSTHSSSHQVRLSIVFLKKDIFYSMNIEQSTSLLHNDDLSQFIIVVACGVVKNERPYCLKYIQWIVMIRILSLFK